MIALDNMLKAQKHVVAIIPESFINSSYMQKNKIYSITVLEDNPFEDTENPVCVVCFDGIEKSFSKSGCKKLLQPLFYLINYYI